MPKKRQQFKSFKPQATATTSSARESGSPALPFYSLRHAVSTADERSADKPSRGVNDILANLRRTTLGPSAPRDAPANSPSVPPAIRQILQLPETPVPAPWRTPPPRFDRNGRRLPAGPPPPRSWVAERSGRDGANRIAGLSGGTSSGSEKMCALGAAVLTLPGIYLPERGSLIDLTLRRIAHDWHYQRYYNQYHLYFVPNHLKPALIRSIEVVGGHALSLSDLKTLLLPPPEASGEAELECESIINREMTYLDLSGSVGRAIQLKELTEFLFPSNQTNVSEEPEDSWDVAAETAPSPPRSLLPNLTHISLAIEPQQSAGVSWKQLLHFSSRLSSITHLSLAFWPEPCLTPQARNATVSTPQGRNIPYGGTSYYSHSLDDDWSEALLVLRMLSRNLYELEFLDLSGCGAWFKALMLELEHDHVDWTGSWGKISLLRLRVGWTPSVDTAPSEVVAYTEQMETAARIEKHIAAKRAGKGRIITVERDRPEI